MAKGKGWFLESRRHKLSALGIKTGRKILPKKPLTVLSGDQKMFYPKGNSRLDTQISEFGEKMGKMGLKVSDIEKRKLKKLVLKTKLKYPKNNRTKKRARKTGKVMDRQSEKMTVEQPITIVKSLGEIATSGMKKKAKDKNLNFTNLSIITEE